MIVKFYFNYLHSNVKHINLQPQNPTYMIIYYYHHHKCYLIIANVCGTLYRILYIFIYMYICTYYVCVFVYVYITSFCFEFQVCEISQLPIIWFTLVPCALWSNWTWYVEWTHFEQVRSHSESLGARLCINYYHIITSRGASEGQLWPLVTCTEITGEYYTVKILRNWDLNMLNLHVIYVEFRSIVQTHHFCKWPFTRQQNFADNSVLSNTFTCYDYIGNQQGFYSIHSFIYFTFRVSLQI